MAKYHAVISEKRFEQEVGHFTVYFKEKTMSSKKNIQNWIDRTGRSECEVMTERQYQNALEAQNI